MNRRAALLFVLCALLIGGCASPPDYVYEHIPGRTAVLNGSIAIAPLSAPPEVHAAVAAGNRIAGLPYSRGGGHAQAFDRAYDCSGAASFMLQAAGALDSPTTSRAFRRYGERGPGDWISVYARRGHVFLVVAGLRFDTGWNGPKDGPRWTTRSRPTRGYVVRHPVGL